jgi:hypothetical protein
VALKLGKGELLHVLGHGLLHLWRMLAQIHVAPFATGVDAIIIEVAWLS